MADLLADLDKELDDIFSWRTVGLKYYNGDPLDCPLIVCYLPETAFHFRDRWQRF